MQIHVGFIYYSRFYPVAGRTARGSSFGDRNENYARPISRFVRIYGILFHRGLAAGNARRRAGYRSIDIFFRSLTTTSEREISCLGIKDFFFLSFNYEIFKITRFAHASSGVIVHLYDNARMPALYSHGTPGRNAFSQSSDLANARSSARMPITKEASPLWIDESHGRFNENHLDADLALIKTS